jgi:putative endonuclease
MSAENPARKPWWRRWFGNRSEQAAAAFLREQKYRILSQNFSCKLGELDLVALDGRCVVFVEVRSTGGDDPLRAALSVNTAKQRRLTRLAQHYLQRYRLQDHLCRFDVLTLHWPADQDQPNIAHYKNAFEAVE